MANRPTITNNIRHLRFTSNEMSQNTLASKVGVTRQTIATIEKAKYGNVEKAETEQKYSAMQNTKTQK